MFFGRSAPTPHSLLSSLFQITSELILNDEYLFRDFFASVCVYFDVPEKVLWIAMNVKCFFAITVDKKYTCTH